MPTSPLILEIIHKLAQIALFLPKVLKSIHSGINEIKIRRKVMVKKKKISKKLDKHFQNKKKLTLTLAAAFIVTAIFIGTAFIYYEVTTTSTKNQTIAESDKPAADRLREMATESIAKDNPQALALFKAAKMQYEYVVENTTNQAIKDDAQNGLIDCNAQVWMLTH